MERPCSFCEVELGKDESVTCYTCKNEYHKSSCVKEHGCIQILKPKEVANKSRAMTRNRRNQYSKDHLKSVEKVKRSSKKGKKTTKTKENSSEYMKLLKEYLSFENHIMNDDLSN